MIAAVTVPVFFCHMRKLHIHWLYISKLDSKYNCIYIITECGLGKSISLNAVLTVHVYGFGQPKPIIYQLFLTSEAQDLRNLGRTYPES